MAAFLLAYTGLSITKHTCVSCKSTIYYLLSHTDCCTGHLKTHSNTNDSCCNDSSHAACSINEATDNCCHTEKIYLKVHENIFFSNIHVKTQPVSLILFTHSAVNLNYDAFYSIDKVSNNQTRPPPHKPSAHDILIKQSQLIYYA